MAMTTSAISSSSRPPSVRSRAGSVSTIGDFYDDARYAPPPVPPLPSASVATNATHSSLIPSRYVKHASLVNNCYPVRPDEKGPKSSDLSYLVYYTTAKPAKLTKVGSYIERRVLRDFRKKRLSDVHCSLEIIRTLVLSSKAHLNIFSKNVIVILDAILVDISDFDIVRHCQTVFSCFASAYDGSTLGVDPEFRTLYERVISRFASIATHSGDDSDRYRLLGLTAIGSAVASSALYACDYRAQLNMVLPPILDCLIDSKTGIPQPLFREPASASSGPSPRPSMSTDREALVTDRDVIDEALRCLHTLFCSPNGGYVRHTLGPTFAYLDDHSPWWPSTFGVSMIRTILGFIQPQFRHMVVNEIIASIDMVEVTTPDLTLQLQKKNTLVSALESILVSPLSLIGIPVLEILNSLLTSLTKSLSESATLSKEGESSQHLVLETLLQDGLVRSIGGLATHIYYANQVPNIISHIASKLSYQVGVSPQPETIDGVPTVDFRKALLRCLTAVIKTSKSQGQQEAGFNTMEVSSDVLTPCLGLMLDGNPGVRAAFAQSLITFLAADDDHSLQGSRSGPSAESPVPTISGDLYFRAATHQTLHTYARLSTATPTDMAAIYGILRALFSRFQDDEFMRAVPVLFSLQDWCLQQPHSEEIEAQQQAETHLIARKRALATVIVIYLQKAASNYDMAEPLQYLQDIQSSRESESQWIPIYYENQESLVRTTGYQWETPSEPVDPVLSHPLAREHLVTLLTTVSDRFRAAADRLTLAYSPENQPNMQLTPHGGQKAFAGGLYITPLSQPGGGPVAHRPERSMDGRIRISRHLEEWALPKIHHHDMTTASSTAMTTSTATLASGQLGVLDEGVEESTETLASATPKRKPSLGISIASGGGGGLGDRAWTPTMGKRIGVDQLKAALATAAQSHSSVDGASETASSTAGSETRGTTSSPHRSGYLHPAYAHSATLARGGGGGGASKQQLMTMAQPSSLASSRPDLADLLNTIQVSAPSTNQSNVSLVTPPY